jgi:HEPN domain-containing protein
MATTDAWVDAFISTSFRDAADEDYIVARAAYRLGLNHTFLWASLQAVEKYLKAILLYNRVSTLRIGHDVKKAFRRLCRVRDILFSFPPDIQLFIDYVNEEGPNRYRGFPSSLRGDALLGLDRTVWHLRRYCYNLRGDRTDASHLSAELASIKSNQLDERSTFRIPSGFLEKVLSSPSNRREFLVWKNFWYGARPRRRIRALPHRFAMNQPIHFMRPAVYFALRDLVQFEAPVREHFERGSGNGS